MELYTNGIQLISINWLQSIFLHNSCERSLAIWKTTTANSFQLQKKISNEGDKMLYEQQHAEFAGWEEKQDDRVENEFYWQLVGSSE